jgi:hypothetical protein
MADLIFSLDIERKEKESYLVIYVQDKAFSSRIVYADTLQKGVGLEKELYRFLLAEHLKTLGISPLSDRVSTVSIQKIRLSSTKALECIKLLALAKKLQWKGASLFYNPLTFAEVCFIAKEELGRLTVSGVCQVDGRKIPFEQIDLFFTGEKPWCIAERSVIIFSDDVDKHLLSKVVPSCYVLEGKKKEQFIDLYFDDSDAPSIQWHLESSPHEEVKQEPLSALPVLVLQDARGAFASLYMDYGIKGRVAYHDAMGSYRDRALEKSWEKDLLETGFQKKIVGSSHYFCPLDQVTKTLSFLLELGWTLIDSKGRKVCRFKESSFDIRAENEHIIASGTLSYEDHMVDLKNVVGSFVRRESFVQISPFAVGLIDDRVEKDVSSFADAEITGEGARLKSCKAGLRRSRCPGAGGRAQCGAPDPRPGARAL